MRRNQWRNMCPHWIPIPRFTGTARSSSTATIPHPGSQRDARPGAEWLRIRMRLKQAGQANARKTQWRYYTQILGAPISYLTSALRVMFGRMDLPGEQLLVEASAREQLVVGSLVDDPAAVHDHDRLGTGDRA